MQFTAIQGVNVRDDTFAQADMGKSLFLAGAAFSCGHTLIYDTAVTTGKQAVKLTASGTAHDEHLICGGYSDENGNCVGGSGAVTTTSGLSGRDAATNDFVYVTRKGPCKLLVDGTADLAAKDRLKAWTTAGTLAKDLGPAVNVTPVAVYPSWPVSYLDAAYTTDATLAAKMCLLT